ncbi:MAG TPA: response regulator transcription factor [Cyclobacteriaceae bacterium]|nr:response regulator transcription factor [Cyclobacteriaceae bacterium]
MTRIRLVLADDHPMIRAGFKTLLAQSDAFEVAGEADNGEELIKVVTSVKPDVALVDLHMPGTNGLEALEKLHGSFPAIKFIVLTMHEEREYVHKALKAGADGYLLKNIDREELENAIHTVFKGGKYFSPEITAVLADSVARPSAAEVSEITPREKEVLVLVAAGHSTKQIADQLGISIRTVETHRINMLKKMEVSNSAELVRKAFETGMLK